MNVRLELIDQQTGQVFAQSEVPVEKIPLSFTQKETVLQVADADYAVVRAEPDSREAAEKAGCVRLTLRKITAEDSKTMLFDLCTIEDSCPTAGPESSLAKGTAIEMAQDDYRQIEYVHSGMRAQIDAELADIQTILTTHKNERGFDAIHVRQRIPQPLQGTQLKLTDLAQAMKINARALAVGGIGSVAGGFCFPGADSMIYGVEQAGLVTVLGMRGLIEEFSGRLQPLAQKHQLLLVDWLGGQII